MISDISANTLISAACPCRRKRIVSVASLAVCRCSPAMCIAFLAGFNAGLAADAARGVNVKLVAVHYAFTSAPDALRMRQADTLNSGILLRGSSVRCVSIFALCLSAQ